MRQLAVFTLALSVLTVGPVRAEEVPAAVDGLFGDWASVVVRSEDDSDNEARETGGLDLLSVAVRSDRERVTFLIELAPEVNLQSANELTIIIDGDGDETTGESIEGIGAELTWTFGKRRGLIWRDGHMRRIEQKTVGLLQAPTVSSDRFEVSFLRWSPDLGEIIAGPHMAYVLIDETGASGDRLPESGGAPARLSNEPPPPASEASLERHDPDDIRVLTYNVLFDGLFKRPAAFLRILKAVDPDIICFQEIWSHTARQAADQVSLAIPDVAWHGAHTTEGQIVSRYPFTEHEAIDEAGNYWALVDLPDDRYDRDIAVVSAHPPCCEKERERQEQLDAIAAWLRDKTRDPASSLPHGTPIVVGGDMNLVGGANQLRTLLAGEIVYEEKFGPSSPPDWDGTPLADSDPRHAGGLPNFTWRDARSSFAPGKLDYIVYSDSVLVLGNAFVLATEELDDETLGRYGLRPGDTLEASDHLPVVADLRLRNGLDAPGRASAPEGTSEPLSTAR